MKDDGRVGVVFGGRGPPAGGLLGEVIQRGVAEGAPGAEVHVDGMLVDASREGAVGGVG